MKSVHLFLTSCLLLLSFKSALADQGKLLVTNEPSLWARNKLITSAVAGQEIEVEYYEADQDAFMLGILGLLQQAAQRGITVHLLIDNLHNHITAPQMAAMMQTPGFEIRVFNPVKNLDVFEQTYRNHDKMMNLDGQQMIIGGRNLSVDYFQTAGAVNYRDIDLFVQGPSAMDAKNYFLELWNNNPMVQAPFLNAYSQDSLTQDCDALAVSSVCERQVGQAQQDIADAQAQISDAAKNILAPSPGDTIDLQQKLINFDAKFVFDDPDKTVANIQDRFENQFIQLATQTVSGSTSASLTVITPYLYPTPEEMAMLQSLADQGVHLKFITNSIQSTDEMLAQVAYASIKPNLIAMGADIFEYTGPEILHAKVAVFNENSSAPSFVIGSFNFDNRSAYINREIGIYISGQDTTVITSNLQNAITGILQNAVQTGGDHAEVNANKMDQLTDPAKTAQFENSKTLFTLHFVRKQI